MKENLSQSGKAALNAANAQKDKLSKKIDEKIAKMGDNK